MPIDEKTGNFYPSRPSKAKCDGCHRTFALGYIPTPNWHGERICRDCRHERAGNDVEEPKDPNFLPF